MPTKKFEGGYIGITRWFIGWLQSIDKEFVRKTVTASTVFDRL